MGLMNQTPTDKLDKLNRVDELNELDKLDKPDKLDRLFRWFYFNFGRKAPGMGGPAYTLVFITGRYHE
jgi:hypothetical protein